MSAVVYGFALIGAGLTFLITVGLILSLLDVRRSRRRHVADGARRDARRRRSMTDHWMERAIGNGAPSTKYLGEDENGDLFVPSRSKADWWDRRFNPRNPLHWMYWLRSRRDMSVVMLERP
jgi:hypothetical protein